MISKEEVLESLQKEIWSPLAVNAVIAEKVEKRAQKGQSLQMYSLEIQPRNEQEVYNTDNIDSFVNNLYLQACSSENPIRIQLIVRTSNVHWTAMDIEASRLGIKCINIDAVADPSSIGAKEIFDRLVKKYEDPNQSRFYFLRDSVLPSDPTKKQGIQYDESSCSIFALDTLFHLANLDVFTIIENRELEVLNKTNAFKIPLLSPNERFFNANNIPPEFAFVYRGTQSKESFASLPSSLHQQEVNKKGDTLLFAEDKHTEEIQYKGKPRARNQAIVYKRDGFIKDVKEHLERYDFLEKIVEGDVLLAMQHGPLASTRDFNQTAVTAKLLEEARAITTQKSSWMSVAGLRDRYKLMQADTALQKGHNTTAISHLETMSTLTSEYKTRLGRIKDQFHAKEAQIPEGTKLHN